MTPELAANVVRAVEKLVGPSGQAACLDDGGGDCVPAVVAYCGPLNCRTVVMFANLRGLSARVPAEPEDVIRLRRELGQDLAAPIRADQGT